MKLALMSLGGVCLKITDGTHHSPPITSEGVPYVTAKHIKPDGLKFFEKPWYISEESHREIYSRCDPKQGDVLYIKDGATTGVAAVNTYDFPFSMLSSVALLRPKPELCDSRFLCSWLNSPDSKERFTGMMGGAAIKRLTLAKIKTFKIPLPPLADQRRIADVLNRAEALRAKRRAALAQLDTLTQSLFLDLFGDPVGKGWGMATIADVGASEKGSIRTGPFGSQLLHSEFTDSGVAVLGIDNAVTNEFRWGDRRYISESKYQRLKRYTVLPQDVLITIMGTCGRCAIVPEEIPPAINTKHLCCITLNQKMCLPHFLHAYFLRHPIALKYLGRTAKGAIMSGLNMGLIKEMPVPLPPLDLQREFARQVAAMEKLKATHRASLTELDTLFASLQHRAFRGEL